MKTLKTLSVVAAFLVSGASFAGSCDAVKMSVEKYADCVVIENSSDAYKETISESAEQKQGKVNKSLAANYKKSAK